MIKGDQYICDLCETERTVDKLFICFALNGELRISHNMPLAASKKHICLNCLEKIMEFMHGCLGQFIEAVYGKEGESTEVVDFQVLTDEGLEDIRMPGKGEGR